MPGSRGFGICVKAGVSAHMHAEPSRRWAVVAQARGVTCDIPVVSHVARRMEAYCDAAYEVSLSIEPALPVGCGYGMSASSAVAAAQCLSRLADRRPPVWELAYEADVVTGGGRGDVVTLRHGGALVRREPGLWGACSPIPAEDVTVVCGTFGPVSTAGVLADPSVSHTLAQSGDACLSELGSLPTLERAMELSFRSARAGPLCTPRVAAALDTLFPVLSLPPAQAMLGESVFCCCVPGEAALATHILSRLGAQTDVTTVGAGA